MCFFGFVTRFLIIVFGILLPARYTHNALSENALIPWAKYWIVYGWLVCVEFVGDTFFKWLPLYAESKLLIVLWLVISAPQASVWIFDAVLNPLLLRYTAHFDHFLVYGKRHLLADALSYSSEMLVRSMDTIVPAVSQIWKRPSQLQASNVGSTHQEIEANQQKNVYFDPVVDDGSQDAPNDNTQSCSVLTEQLRKVARESLPDLALKPTDKSIKPISRSKRKQYVYDVQLDERELSLNSDPLTGIEDLLKTERIAVELQQRHLPRKENRRRY